MAELERMKNKRVLVSGSGTGIGRGVAIEFAREGATVALHYSRSAQGAEEAVKEIEEFGGKAKAFQADLSKVVDCKKLAEEAIEFLGGMDVLVNNAGITVNRPFLEVTPEQFDKMYNVNIRGQFFLTQGVVPTMEEQGGGVVINVTSVHAFGGMREHSVYAGTKGAIVAYTRELATEMAVKGIRVNAIAPGWVRVKNQETAMGEDFDWKAAGETLPAGFVAWPKDVAKAFIFMASEESKYIYGQTVVIDGGQLAILPNTGSFRDPIGVQFGSGYVPGV